MICAEYTSPVTIKSENRHPAHESTGPHVCAERIVGLKVLHAAFQAHSSPGIAQQMAWEQAAARELGVPWESVLWVADEQAPARTGARLGHLTGRAFAWMRGRMAFYAWLSQQAHHYDLVLLRHSSHDPLEVRFVSRSPVKIATVHHTKEVQELATRNGSMAGVRARAEAAIGRRVLGLVDALIGVTSEIVSHEVARVPSRSDLPTFVYPNGVVVGHDPCPDSRSGVPRIAFVAASFASWHGLDRLMDALDRDNEECYVDVIGQTPAPLMSRLSGDPRVVLHGVLPQRQIDEVLASAWCGLSSLALDRQEMEEACPLKVRHYLSGGVPVYAGHRDSGIPEAFPYFRRGSVELSEVLSFATEHRNVSREHVRQSAKPFIDKRPLLESLYRALQAASM